MKGSLPRPFSPTDAKRDREEKARLAERGDGALRVAGGATVARIIETRTELGGEITTLDTQMGDATLELGRVATKVDTDLPQAINDAAASPITDERLTAGSLTTWPFQSGAVPAGALEKGAVGMDEIADFSIVARKLNTGTHTIY